MLRAVRTAWRSDYATVCKAVHPGSNPGVASNFHSEGFSMIKSKVLNGEHVQTYVPPDGNVHRKLALVEAHLTNPILLRVIPLIFSLMARWRRCALGNAVRAVGRYLRGPHFRRGLQRCLCGCTADRCLCGCTADRCLCGCTADRCLCRVFRA